MSRRTGEHSEEGPPVPIPNTAVKLFSSDDTLGVAPRENRTSPFHPPIRAVFLCLRARHAIFSSVPSGNVPEGDDLLLGLDGDGNPVIRAWKRAKAILILGLQGGGKTSTAIWLLLQVVLKGGRLGLIDKHVRSEDDSMYGRLRGLRAAFDVPVGDTPLSAMRVVQHARKVLDTRFLCAQVSLTTTTHRPRTLVQAAFRQSGTGA